MFQYLLIIVYAKLVSSYCIVNLDEAFCVHAPCTLLREHHATTAEVFSQGSLLARVLLYK